MKINVASPLLILVVIFTFFACEDAVKLPKQRMYPRVKYPERGYVLMDTALCDFSFRIPKYCTIQSDTFVFRKQTSHPCWFNISTPSLNAVLYCSYHEIRNQQDFSDLINDAFEIVGKHNIKANYRKETIISNAQGVHGIMFDIEGPVASPVQFYLTDEKKHFFRGSLYFNSKVNPDSTAPVLSFIKTDIDTLISSFKWK
jgi:gliding motility-associated lipoprotein GldD